MKLSIESGIYILLSFGLLFTILYWYGDYHKSDKFKVFFTALGGIAILFSIFAIILQALNYKENITNNDIHFFETLSRDLIQDTLNLFIENQDMSYYYNDLIGVQRINENTIRNIDKENEISMLILSRFASIIYYIDQEGNTKRINSLKTRFEKVLNTFMKSPTFREYYMLYKQKLSGPETIKYFQKKYNI